jgi:hypothetical protein
MQNSGGKSPASIALGAQINGQGTLIKVYWENPQNVGDTFVLVDSVTGALLLPGRCEVANQSQIFDESTGLSPIPFKGIGCSALSSGTLYVTID